MRQLRASELSDQHPFSSFIVTETGGEQALLVPEDWEAQFTGLAMERAVLRAVVGQIFFAQTVVGAPGTPLFWGIFLRDVNVPAATAFPVFTVASMGQFTWLWTGARGAADAVTGNLAKGGNTLMENIAIKAKRRLTSQTAIYISAQFGADAGSPAVSIGGLLRFLVARD